MVNMTVKEKRCAEIFEAIKQGVRKSHLVSESYVLKVARSVERALDQDFKIVRKPKEK